MRLVPDGVGTAPIGVRLSPDGQTVLRRELPGAQRRGRRRPRRRSTRPAIRRTSAARRSRPSRAAATTTVRRARASATIPAAGCARPTPTAARPCRASVKQDCVPLILGQPVSSITGGIAADPLPAALLDGKILFNTAARDASVAERRRPRRGGSAVQQRRAHRRRAGQRGEHVARRVLRHLLDVPRRLRRPGRPHVGLLAVRRVAAEHHGPARPAGLLAGHLQQRSRPKECFFDAACGDGNFCKMNPQMIPPNVPAADRDRYFNPMLTVHWSGDRDEVEDFEHTYRSLLGSGDCDGVEFTPTCQGALIQRSAAHVERSGRRQRRPRRPEPQHPRRARGEHRHPPDAHGRLRLLAHGLRAEPEPADRRRRSAGASSSTTRRPSAPPATTAARASGASSSPTRSRIPGSIRRRPRGRGPEQSRSSDTTSARRTSSTRPIRWPSPRRTRPTRIRGTRATRGPSPRAAARSPTTSRPC